MIMVPFKGDSDGAIALAGQHIDAHIAVPVSYKALAEANKIRVLAVASETRSPFYDMLPTFKENGIDLVIAAFHGVYVPKDTPQPVIEKLADAIESTMQSTSVRSEMANAGAGLASMRGDAATDFLHQQDRIYRTIIERLNLRIVPTAKKQLPKDNAGKLNLRRHCSLYRNRVVVICGVDWRLLRNHTMDPGEHSGPKHGCNIPPCGRPSAGF
jgi:hypothetical protein